MVRAAAKDEHAAGSGPGSRIGAGADRELGESVTVHVAHHDARDSELPVHDGAVVGAQHLEVERRGRRSGQQRRGTESGDRVHGGWHETGRRERDEGAGLDPALRRGERTVR